MKLTQYSINQLDIGQRVSVNRRLGTVQNVHQPTWRDHFSKSTITRLSGADVLFDDQPAYRDSGLKANVYVDIDDIEVIKS